MPQPVAEFRGCENLVIAEVLQDDENGYVTGEVSNLCPVASIAKTVEQSNSTSFYDNIAMINILAKGADTVTLIVPSLTLAQLAIITGATVDPVTGAYMSGNSDSSKTYALGYKLNRTNKCDRYVWRLKGQFTAVPDEQSDTMDNNTNTNNQTVTFTGMDTVFKFTNGGHRKDVVIDDDGKCNLASFFSTVITPDTQEALAVSAVSALSITPATKSATIGTDYTYTLSITPSGVQPIWVSSNPSVLKVDQTGKATPIKAGTAVVTATAGAYSSASVVTVSAGG